MWQSIYPARTSCRFLSTSGTAGECQGRVTRRSLPLVRTLSKQHRAGDLHIHPKPRNAHVPQGFPRSGNVAGHRSWRNAILPQAVAEGVAGPLRILAKRAGPCAAWIPGERCGVAAKTGEGERAAAGVGREGGCRGRARGEGRGARGATGRPFVSLGGNLAPWHRGRFNNLWMSAMREYGSIGASDPERKLLDRGSGPSTFSLRGAETARAKLAGGAFPLEAIARSLGWWMHEKPSVCRSARSKSQ